MKTLMKQRALVAFAAAGLTVGAAQAEIGVLESPWRWTEVTEVVNAVPPLPPLSTFPVQLVLDDDTADGSFGVAGQTARQFLWFNRFSPAAGFHLEEVWVLFPSGTNMTVGGAVQIAIYDDADGDPSNGATLLQSFDTTIQAADGNTFSIYPLPASVLIEAGRDLLVGVVPRFIVSGVTSPTTPAALDTTTSQARSWLAVWSTDPPDPPALLPLPDQTLALVDAFVPGGGNWMIRAFGSEQGITEIPTLGEWGLAALALALFAAGAFVLRRRKAAAAIAPLLLVIAAIAAPAGAVIIDSFTTNQAAVSDPPGTGSTATGGADIIGTRRGLVPDLLLGAGPTSAGVAGGVLSFSVTGTTPDSRGEAVVSWDGDTNPNVLNPIGLAAVDLTASGHSGFRIVVNSATAGTELELQVYTATEHSSLGRRLPAIAAPTSIFIPFAEFRDAVGAGASFAQVGAIVLTIRGTEVAAVIDLIETSAPIVAATKVDTQIVDSDGDTRLDPGDRVRYTVTVTNTGNQALNVDLTDSVDANTTLVAGSVSSTPVAHNDQYGWFGNVTLIADGVTPQPLLLANDADADGDDLDVQSVVSPTAAGGTVTLDDAETGEFTYSPPAGFSGVDSFNYTVVDDNGNTATATANIALEGVVWFVDDSNTTAPFLGTFADPFQTLASVNGTDPDQPGDIVFLYDDNGTPYAGGHVMEADQQFLGEGVGLILSGTTIVPAGGTPQMTNGAGAAITLGLNSTIHGLDVTNASGAGIVGTSFGTFTASSVNVTGVGGATLDLATGALTTTFGTLSSAGTAGQRGLQLVTVTGSLTATTTALINPTTQGIRVATSPAAALSFGNTTITDNAIGSGPTATGIDLATGNGGATFTFGSLTLTTEGAGLLANNSGTINVQGTGNTIVATGGPAIDVTATSVGSGWTFATLSSTNSANKGVNLDSVTGPVTANGGAISGPTGIGFDLNGGLANVTYAGTISNTANALLIEVTSRSGSSTTTFSGNLSSTSTGNGIRVASHLSGNPTITFSGASMTLNTSAGAAVTLDDNDTATINFTGGNLDIDTPSGTGFNATGGAAAITVQGTNNTINSTSATALNVANTVIGAADLNFQSISAGNNTAAADPLNGIVLNATGASGNLVISGTGAANSGGTIQGTTGVGISLSNTRDVSLNNLNIQNTARSGIEGTQVVNFTFTNGTINNSSFPGNNALPDDSNIGFNVTPAGTESSVSGTVTITGNTLTNAGFHGIDIRNFNGTLNDVVITGNTVTSSTNVLETKGSGIRLNILGSPGTVANLTKATIANNVISNFPSDAGIEIKGGNSTASGAGGTMGIPGSGTDIISITGNRIFGQSAANRMGTSFIDIGVSGGNGASRSRANFDISNNGTVANPLTNCAGIGIGIGNTGYATSTIVTNGNVLVPNNTVASSGIGGGNGLVTSTAETPDLTWTINNNNISSSDGNGILSVARAINGLMKVKIQGNTVGAPLTGVRPGIRIDAGNNTAGEDAAVCLNISGNTSAGSGGTNGIGLRKQGTVAAINDFGVNGMSATGTPAVESFINGLNPAGNGTLLISATSGFSNCSLP